MRENNETTGTEKALNLLKLAACLLCVGIFCNGILIKGRQGAELAKELKTTLGATAQHTADANEVIEWASSIGR